MNLGIDEFLFKDDPNPYVTMYPGRMAPSTALCFLLLSISIIFDNNKILNYNIFQIPVLVTGTFSLIGLSGYIFKAEEMYAYGGFNSMAFHTVICFFLLAIASLFSHPQDGLMKMVSSDTIGGRLIRKTLPLAIILLFLLCWLHLEGELLGVFNLNFGNGILMISFIIIFTGTLYFTASSLTKFEQKLIVKTSELENSLKELSDYKYALDQSSIVSITDQEGNIKFVNENFVKISKFSKAALIGQNHRIVNSGYHPSEFFTDLWKTVFAGKVWRNDVKSKSKDGTYYWADTTIVPFINKDGKPNQFVAIRKNITKRKAAEDALLNSEMKFRKLFDSSSDAIVLLKNNVFFDCNPSAFKIFGCSSKEELCTKSPHDLSPPLQPCGIDSKTLYSLHTALALGKGSNNFEWTHQRLNTSEIFLAEVRINKFKLDGGEVLQGIIRDITEQKEAAVEKEKLIKELSNKYNELMQFNYIVAHNLRSPIATLLGLTNYFTMINKSKEDQLKTIKYIQQSATKMDDLIKDLNVILSTRSAINTHKEIIFLPAIIKNISDTLEKEITETHCTIKTNIPAGMSELYTVKSYLESILYNLISNAIKFHSDNRKPQIIVSAKKISNNFLISVSDNGIGINLESYGNEIFGLYKRFHLEVEGKGLGLHMTKTQVEALGGSILIESKVNIGTTFIITLPV